MYIYIYVFFFPARGGGRGSRGAGGQWGIGFFFIEKAQERGRLQDRRGRGPAGCLQRIGKFLGAGRGGKFFFSGSKYIHQVSVLSAGVGNPWPCYRDH